MRVNKKDLDFLKNTINTYIQDAKIYLFGSIIDDNKKGGDIDIFIITNKKIDLKTKSKIKYTLENNLLRPVDLVFHKDFNRLIEKEALKGIKI